MIYENESCMEGSRFLTLRIKLWRKYNGKQIRYIQIEKDNVAHFEMASKLWISFIQEVNEHDGTYQSEV